MTKKIGLVLLLIIFMAFAFNVFGQGRELEIKYPEIQGEKPEETTTQVPDYVKYIFNFLIGIGGVIALGALIYAGFQWFTSSGSPERIQNAKEQITAALLGLVILFGSYLILFTINPNLTVFTLKRLRPIISELPAGVLACKEKVKTESGEDAILKAWNLELEFKLLKPNEKREIEIKKELDEILGKVALECHSIQGAGDFMPSFDNKVKYLYFIPSPKELNPDGSFKSMVEYGAVVYEDSNFKGISKVLGYNLIDPKGSADVYVEETTPLKPSSIKPFMLVYDPDPNWEVILYQEYNFNKGLPGIYPAKYSLEMVPCKADGEYTSGSHWYCEADLLPNEFEPPPYSPRSMKIDGELLVILCKDKIQLGSCETFFGGDYSDLEQYDNIVEWVGCKDYHKRTTWNCIINCCAEAAATKLLILSAKPY